MKKRLLAFSFVLLGTATWSFYSADGNLYSESNGAPANGSCTACHGGSNNTDPGLVVTLTDTATSQTITAYEAGKTYNVNITMNKPGISKFGFLLSASSGTLTKISGTTNTQLKVGYATHTSSGTSAVGGSISWNMLWTAPAGGTTTLQVYVNATNNNNASNGDVIYAKQVSVAPQVTGISDVQSQMEFSVYPQPAGNELFVQVGAEEGKQVPFALFDLNGKQAASGNYTAVDGQPIRISTSGLKQGIYLLQVTMDGVSGVKKVMIQ